MTVYSDDQGLSWQSTAMLHFADGHSSAAEAWVVELSDGRLLGTSWHVPRDGDDLANAFAISDDRGTCWQPTRSTGIMGQTTALAPWTDRRALFLYNQRKHGEPGVWLGCCQADGRGFRDRTQPNRVESADGHALEDIGRLERVERLLVWRAVDHPPER